MNALFIILIAIFCIMVVVSLVRGIIAFLQTTKIDLENGTDNSQAMQAKQNQAMFARIKYQALAIVVVAVLLAVNS
ncbi:HIG1 domain-containing protein [Aurantiacibacter marinus]|uniref:Glutamyl-tRNA synthetase n=1 Tax=Aurantiacibacter marinus TaxID=874156 RepID=A0A0H0XX78_9SPHN|nr:HIG1 domain-containing protein [Aurantiacibacter marinus]KLI64885.1 glutamyl-tRNA synthetase [Aurantiacibacter marinus]